MHFTREALYETVWSRTIRDICKTHNVTYAGIVQACEALEVPRPAPGHWGNVALGQTPPRPELAPVPSGARTSMELRPRVPRPRAPAAVAGTTAEARAPRQQHPLVRRTRAAFKGGKPDSRRGLQAAAVWSEPHLDVHAFAATVPRALDVLDRLFQRLKQVGATVDIKTSERERPTTWIKVHNESIQLRLDEKVRVTRRPPTKEEMARPMFTFGPPEVTEYSSTGTLTLRLVNLEGTGARRLWTDNAMGRVEDRLDEVVHGVLAGAVALKQQRVEREEAGRVREVARKRAEREAREAERDGALVDQMLQMQRHWARARELRTFVAEVATLFPIEARGEDMKEWFEVAAWAIDTVDPLSTPAKAREKLTRPDASQWYPDAFLTGTPDPARVRRYASFMAQELRAKAQAPASGVPPEDGAEAWHDSR